MKIRYIICILITLVTACQSDVVFENYQELPCEAWDYNHVLEFKTHIPDSGLYNVTLYVRHTGNFEMTNLWCIVSTRSQATHQLHDTVNIKTATPSGNRLGEGGQIKTVAQTINRNPVSLPKGDVIFRLKQGMYPGELQGIKNIGIRIEKTKE